MLQGEERQRRLEAIHRLLNTPDGQLLVEELAQWDAYSLLGATPEETAYKVGLRDAYKSILEYQARVFVSDDEDATHGGN